MNSSADEIVVTGMGLATCLGLDCQSTWEAVRAGRCGLGPVRSLESQLDPDKGGGEALELPGAGPGPREVRYLRLALGEALAGAFKREERGEKPARVGVVLGTTLHGMRSAGEYLRSENLGALRGFLATAVLRGAVDGLAIQGRPFDGPAMTTCAACSSGLSSVGLAMTLLHAGELDIVIAGGYDPVSEYAHAGFDSLRVVASGPVRPFCRGREGMKVSEGYGVLTMERATAAIDRGAEALACILGYGESSDAHHLTLPHPEGDGAVRAIEQAMTRASAGAREIGLIAAHATATPNNDAAEYAAFSRVFGGDLPAVPVVAFKSHLGHTLGGAGAVELILSIMAMREGVVPPTANIAPEDVEFAGLALNTGAARRASIGLTLNTSLGFGGANTCVIAGPPGHRRVPGPLARHDVVITGLGIVVPGAVGNEAFAARLGASRAGLDAGERGPIPDSAIEHLFSSRRVRRMSDYVKLTLAATALALEDAGVGRDAAFAESCSAILGTTHGSTGFCEPYYSRLVREGPSGANPVLFAEGVPNAASAQLSLMLGLKGGCQTIIGSRTSGLEALRLAALRIASGEWERAIVGGAEEHSLVVDSAYRNCGLCADSEWSPAFGAERGFQTGGGAVTLILERREGAAARGGRVRGVVGRGFGGIAVGNREDRTRSAARAIERTLRALASGGDATYPVLGSANATWIDRAESIGGGLDAGSGQNLASMYGWIPELFSAGPLAGIAAMLLLGRVPSPVGTGVGDEKLGTGEGAGSAACDVVCTDYLGPVAGVRIGLSV